MFEPAALILIGLTFLLAGTVKGVIGLGLPTVTLALLTAAFNLPTAMALLLVPSFATNVWQAAVGGHALSLIKRFWPFFLMATGTVWAGATALTKVDLNYLSALLGALIATYGVISLAGVRITVPARHEAWAGPTFGTMNGVLTGMTGSFVVPGVMFLQAVGLPRDALVQAMGILFTLSTAALAVALGGNGLLDREMGMISAAGLLPAIIGMIIGQKVRRRLSEQLFRKVFFSALVAMGGYIILRSTGL